MCPLLFKGCREMGLFVLHCFWEMKINSRRKIAARILLAVYITIIGMVSLHHHEDSCGMQDVCYSCLYKLPHPSHFSSGTSSWHSCVVCQFHSLPYLFIPFFVLSVLLIAWRCLIDRNSKSNSVTAFATRSPRAPPFVL